MESKAYVSWEEVPISNDKGRRQVHYYLTRSDGISELAVVGKEKSIRHMNYSVASPFLRSLRPSSPKLRSRREVVDWLSSLVTDFHSYESSSLVDRLKDDEDACPADSVSIKDPSSKKLIHHSKEFSWMGSSWTCRKRRKHYQSFCRNGITISVHDFVHVMAEENKRLVAYLEDLYEDSRGNNVVSVRWFHKIDEVAHVLPPNCNDKEIFFSLCLQDLSVECVDGLAAVLNSQHYEKFLNEVRCTSWEPYLCFRQFDNDDVKPFDITQVQGYWKQELLRYMYISSRSSGLKSSSVDGPNSEAECHAEAMRCRPKRNHGLKVGDTNTNHRPTGKEMRIIVKNSNCSGVSSGVERVVSSGSGGSGTATSLPKKVVFKPRPDQHLSVGCSVEVLSLDSGIRGCWFRCVILKRNKDKLKVRYQDVLDADETGFLEEWVLASRVAAPDDLGMRMCGRTTVRPQQPSEGGVSKGIDFGTAVDAWWHDGWWEGIVVGRESEDKYSVHFPGERQTFVFVCDDLRQSLDWVCNRWNHLKERPDLANKILSCKGENCSDGGSPFQAVGCNKRYGVESMAPEDMAKSKVSPCSEPRVLRQKNIEVPNLAKDNSLAHLKWNSSRKRKRSKDGAAKGGSSSSSQDDDGPSAHNRFLIPKSLKVVDHDNCKYGRKPLFAPPIPTLSSLVMSR